MGAPGSASVPLRALWAYPMVQGVDLQPTPLRVPAPVRLLVHAPPATWGWRTVPPARGAAGVTAWPEVRQVRPTYYVYNGEESNAIWLASQAYKATPPVASSAPSSASASGAAAGADPCSTWEKLD